MATLSPVPQFAEPARRFPGLPVRSGALPFRWTADGMEVLLIRRVHTDDWSIPKGHLIDGLSFPDTARIEAMEEAGVIGTIADAPIGSFSHHKARKGFFTSDEIVEVVTYPLEVSSLDRRWQEDGLRHRRWFGIDEACRVVRPPLAALLAEFAGARLPVALPAN